MQAAAKLFKSFGSVRRSVNLPSATEKAGFERRTHAAVIIDYQDPVHSIAPSAGSPVEVWPVSGKVRVKVAPHPGGLAAVSVPPCCSVILRHTASPRPGLPACV